MLYLGGRKSSIAVPCLGLWLSLFVWPAAGRGADPVAGTDPLDAGFKRLQEVQTGFPTDEKLTGYHDGTGGCHNAGKTLDDLNALRKRARQALADFEEAARPPANAADRDAALFFQVVALDTIGDIILAYNVGSKNNPELNRLPLSGAARAYGRALAVIDRVQASTLLKAEYHDLLPYYKGRACVKLGKNQESLDLLVPFNARWTRDARFNDLAGELIASARDSVDRDRRNADTPGKAGALDGAPKPTRALRCEDLGINAPPATPAPPPPSLPGDGKTVKAVTALQPGQEYVPYAPRVTIFASTSIGFDGNLTQLGRTVPTPDRLEGKQAVFNESTVGAQVDLFWLQRDASGPDGDPLADKLSLDYSAAHDYYDHHRAQNLLVQSAHANLARMMFGGKADVEVLFSDTWQRDDETNLNNSVSVKPNVNVQIDPAATVQVSFTEAYFNGFGDAARARGVNGPTHRAAAQSAITVLRGCHNPAAALETTGWLSPQGSLTITPSYGHEWTVTDGTLGDRERDDFLVKIDTVLYAAEEKAAFLRAAVLSGSYEYRRDRYQHATPKLGREQDDAHLFEVALTLKMWYDERVSDRLDVILDYKFKRQYSNFAFKDYLEPIVLASLKYNF